ncbi:hypothetical protein FRAAL5257 [Frankia alni ACN14a]|uniref:Uncharacterized protein n=1 Tax=Frankia alni (strain DSM 45986 / CECT 9034 / ACN14a) TaxID=326424 RepID=Q0RF60_FRAAA|nr:hypothetical protein FRAAL5257 [Frankia alni ACN14a]
MLMNGLRDDHVFPLEATGAHHI